MRLKLSVIIPCYNCNRTLREAVDSCYMQGFSDSEFELVMVDDGSTDRTKELLKELASEHSNIKPVFHEKNQGGGAARNTAVANASADVIFCLDSDDILPAGTLLKMYNFLKEKHCDGVCLHHSTKFIGTDINNIDHVDTFSFAGEKIPLESLLQKDRIMCPLYSVFMFTKQAFEKIGGYPTDHGFDTQGFAWRFLCQGLTAYTCPDTNYLHRIHFSKSYFLREQISGRVNYNWGEIFNEHFAYFTSETQRFLKTFDYKDFTLNVFLPLQQKDAVFTNEAPVTIDKNNIPSLKNSHPVSYWSILGILFRIRAKLRFLLKQHPKIKSLALNIHNSLQDILIRLRDRHFILLIFHYLKLRYTLSRRMHFETKCSKKQEKVDIVVPTISKDVSLLDSFFEHLKQNVCETIDTIYIVAPNSDKIILDYAKNNGYTFIDENTVLGYGKEHTIYKKNEIDLSGWFFQQLLKLGASNFVKNDRYIVVDSDTLLIQPHEFFTKDKTILRQSTEYNKPYRSAYYDVFGYECFNYNSFVVHMMPFDREKLSIFKAEIEEKHRKPWDEALIDTCTNRPGRNLSEYEFYGQWMYKHFSDEIIIKPFYNVSLKRNLLVNLEINKSFYLDKFHSLSFHSHNE